MFAVRFYTMSFSETMVVESESDVGLYAIFSEFMFVFGISVENNFLLFSKPIAIQYSAQIANRLKFFVDKYKTQVPPVNRLWAKFKKINEDEYFFMLPPDVELSAHQRIIVQHELEKINGVEDNGVVEKIEETFQCVFENYHTDVINGVRTFGEKDKSKRVCRFCGRSFPEVTFKQKAHAISEAFGNKNTVLNEECDECNGRFGRTIENSAALYFGVHRVLFGVKGKKGSTKIKTETGVFGKIEGSNKVVLATTQKIMNADGSIAPIQLDTGQRIARQDVYRALCKFALSVMDDYDPEVFSDTVGWINGNQSLKNLPKVAVTNSPRHFSLTPSMSLNIRKSLNCDLPYVVGNFYFTSIIVVFIIPLVKHDSIDFIDDEQYQSFWSCFKHYSNEKWEFRDLSCDTVEPLVHSLNFVKGAFEV
ncbi:HNH endonuclease [Desulfovibrio caledoniensis]